MYTNDPRMPRIRRDVALFAERYGVRVAARHFGFSVGAVSLWKKKLGIQGIHPIPTRSSRPRHHPRQLTQETVNAIVATRLVLRRSAEVIHASLGERGIRVSLPSVKRTLDRENLLRRRSPWKRRHVSVSRPEVKNPGDLMQMDTIHLLRPDGTRIYVFTALDVHSRFAHAWASARANTRTALLFLRRTERSVPFSIRMLQSDHGSEFSTSFSERAKVEHRHSRVRRPNDNAHLERFNRTIQDELIRGLPVDVAIINRALPEYLRWYNDERHHFGLGLKKPTEVARVFTSY